MSRSDRLVSGAALVLETLAIALQLVSSPVTEGPRPKTTDCSDDLLPSTSAPGWAPHGGQGGQLT